MLVDDVEAASEDEANALQRHIGKAGYLLNRASTALYVHSKNLLPRAEVIIRRCLHAPHRPLPGSVSALGFVGKVIRLEDEQRLLAI